MIDIKFLRENPDVVKQNIKNKFQDSKLPLVDEVIEFDKKSRAVKQEADQLRANRNKFSKQIGALYGQGKKEEAEEMKKLVTEQGDRLAELEKQEAELQEEVTSRMMVIPNIIDKSVPINAVLFYVASTKFCAFESINDAYLAQTDYLYNYVDGFSLDDFVKALNFANSIKDKVIPYLNKSLSEAPALQDLLNNTHDDLCTILFKVMLSIIKLRLKKSKFKIREDQISKILFEAQLTYIKLSDVETLYLRPTMVSTLTHQKGLDFGIKDNDFVSIKSPLDAISEVLGVLPIPTIASLANIKESLKIRQKDALAISSSIVKLQKNAV